MQRSAKPPVVVLMGPAGSGKTTVGARLATRLRCPFMDGDDLHPPANVAKMARGEALDEADRAPWLLAVARVIDEWRLAGRGGVVTCSGLRRRYRDVIAGARRGVTLVYLKGERELLHQRLVGRTGHFMPATLLDSQLEALEEPDPDEAPIVIGIDQSPDRQVDEIIRMMNAGNDNVLNS